MTNEMFSVRRVLASIFLVTMVNVYCSLAQDHLYSISLSGSYTTSSKLFYFPNDADEFLRNQHIPLDNIFGLGLDVRREIGSSGLHVGISVEYISKRDESRDSASTRTPVPVNDGYTAIPIELSGFFTIPFSTETIQMYMGGGVGMYIGKRNYDRAGVHTRTVNQQLGFGIHILSGVQYQFDQSFALRSELKFRDIQFETTTVFPVPYTNYNGTFVQFDQKPSASRININGMTLTLGIVYLL